MTDSEATPKSRFLESRKTTTDESAWTKALNSLLAAVKALGCADCAGRRRLTFDHLPEFVKLFSPSKPPPSATLAVVEAEIAKCEVVCRGCHDARERARGRMGSPPLRPPRPRRISIHGLLLHSGVRDHW